MVTGNVLKGSFQLVRPDQESHHTDLVSIEILHYILVIDLGLRVRSVLSRVVRHLRLIFLILMERRSLLLLGLLIFSVVFLRWKQQTQYQV